MRSRKSNRTRQNQRKSYTKGELNRLIDCIFHPLYSKNEIFRVLDGLAHGLVEKDPSISTMKFLRYNFPEIVKKISKRSR